MLCIIIFSQEASIYTKKNLSEWKVMLAQNVCTLYMGVQFTLVYNVHGCTMYMGVQCTWVYNVHAYLPYKQYNRFASIFHKFLHDKLAGAHSLDRHVFVLSQSYRLLSWIHQTSFKNARIIYQYSRYIYIFFVSKTDSALS